MPNETEKKKEGNKFSSQPLNFINQDYVLESKMPRCLTSK